jgi:hypothetical protein
MFPLRLDGEACQNPTTMRWFRSTALLFILLSIAVSAGASKRPTSIIMLWPNDQNATLSLTFERFHQIGGYGGQLSFMSDVTVKNLSDHRISRASFTVYLFDKDQVRIGDGVLQVKDLEPAQGAKIGFQFFSIGVPNSLRLVAKNDAAWVPTSLKTVQLKIISVPPGASLKVDGNETGVTPMMTDLSVGNHVLEFSKEGYATGSTPVDVTQDEIPGGSITFELGGLSRDTVELRDGRALLGDVVSVSMTSLVLRIDGKEQTYDRNQVKKIMLVEREITPSTAVPQASSTAQPTTPER